MSARTAYHATASAFLFARLVEMYLWEHLCEQHPLISRLQLDCQSWLKFFGMLSPLS